MSYIKYDGDDDDCQERKVYVYKTEQYADKANTAPLWHTVMEIGQDPWYFGIICYPVDER